jgi:hypothetical protein
VEQLRPGTPELGLKAQGKDHLDHHFGLGLYTTFFVCTNVCYAVYRTR